MVVVSAASVASLNINDVLRLNISHDDLLSLSLSVDSVASLTSLNCKGAPAFSSNRKSAYRSPAVLAFSADQFNARTSGQGKHATISIPTIPRMRSIILEAPCINKWAEKIAASAVSNHASLSGVNVPAKSKQYRLQTPSILVNPPTPAKVTNVEDVSSNTQRPSRRRRQAQVCGGELTLAACQDGGRRSMRISRSSLQNPEMVDLVIGLQQTSEWFNNDGFEDESEAAVEEAINGRLLPTSISNRQNPLLLDLDPTSNSIPASFSSSDAITATASDRVVVSPSSAPPTLAARRGKTDPPQSSLNPRVNDASDPYPDFPTAVLGSPGVVDGLSPRFEFARSNGRRAGMCLWDMIADLRSKAAALPAGRHTLATNSNGQATDALDERAEVTVPSSDDSSTTSGSDMSLDDWALVDDVLETYHQDEDSGRFMGEASTASSSSSLTQSVGVGGGSGSGSATNRQQRDLNRAIGTSNNDSSRPASSAQTVGAQIDSITTRTTVETREKESEGGLRTAKDKGTGRAQVHPPPPPRSGLEPNVASSVKSAESKPDNTHASSTLAPAVVVVARAGVGARSASPADARSRFGLPTGSRPLSVPPKRGILKPVKVVRFAVASSPNDQDGSKSEIVNSMSNSGVEDVNKEQGQRRPREGPEHGFKPLPPSEIFARERKETADGLRRNRQAGAAASSSLPTSRNGSNVKLVGASMSGVGASARANGGTQTTTAPARATLPKRPSPLRQSLLPSPSGAAGTGTSVASPAADASYKKSPRAGEQDAPSSKGAPRMEFPMPPRCKTDENERRRHTFVAPTAPKAPQPAFMKPKAQPNGEVKLGRYPSVGMVSSAKGKENRSVGRGLGKAVRNSMVPPRVGRATVQVSADCCGVAQQRWESGGGLRAGGSKVPVPLRSILTRLKP